MIAKKIENGLETALWINFSLLVSLWIFMFIYYLIEIDILEVRTSTIGYIVTSILLGFLLVWIIYSIIKRIRNNK